MKILQLNLAGLLALQFVAVTSHAQNDGPFELNRSVVAGGGGTCSGGPFTLSGTAGQPAAGVMAGGNFKLEGGFWNGVTALQTSGSPLLKIKLLAGKQVLLSWPKEAAGFALEYTTNVTSGKWSASPGPVVDTITEHTVTISTSGNRCYRLKKP